MAKVSNVSFSTETTNNITDAFVALQGTKDAIGVEKEKAEGQEKSATAAVEAKDIRRGVSY